jgi:IclR helix-turn-helix domain
VDEERRKTSRSPGPQPQGAAVREGWEVTITLTGGQVARVLREASADPALDALPGGLDDFDELCGAVLPLLEDSAYSRSTLRALLVLSAFPPDSSERELTDVARQVGLSPSTTHRYICTWTALGLLEQHARTRRYRRTPSRSSGVRGP